MRFALNYYDNTREQRFETVNGCIRMTCFCQRQRMAFKSWQFTEIIAGHFFEKICWIEEKDWLISSHFEAEKYKNTLTFKMSYSPSVLSKLWFWKLFIFSCYICTILLPETLIWFLDQTSCFFFWRNIIWIMEIIIQ